MWGPGIEPKLGISVGMSEDIPFDRFREPYYHAMHIPQTRLIF